MKNWIVLTLACILFAGCTSAGKTFDLPAKYAPLKHLKARSEIPGLGLAIRSASTITTLGESAYVKDVDEWLKKNPPAGRRFHSIMRHEQEHSKRQLATGTKKWVSKYLFSKSFAWKEEQIGWYYELTLLKSYGFQVNIVGVAKTLSGYTIATGKIVSFEEALKWVEDVMAGRWKPAE